MKKSLKRIKSEFLKKSRVSLYASFVNRYPVEKNTIFYHAYRTRIMAGNPYAIFKELVENEEYSEYQHIWVYTTEKSLDYDTFRRYKDLPNVKLVKANSKEHIKALATCQYFIDNAALPAYWVKRDGQIYINTWHGTPLKALGKTAKDSSKASISNAQRNFFMCDYMVMPNKYTIEKMIESYDLQGLASCNVLDAGYPRNDLVLNTNRNHIISLLEKKCGHSLKQKKIVLYGPTFRSKKGKSLNTSEEMCKYIEEMVEGLPDDYVMFFKVHNTLGAYFKGNKDIEDYLIFDEIETNELLSVTDILITDYSSIFFDFLCTGKPILFFVYDREEYEKDHGIYLDIDSMPGELCYSTHDVIEQIKRIDGGNYSCDRYKMNVEAFAYNDDGNASKRVIDIIFNRKMSEACFKLPKNNKKKLLISASNDLTAGDMQLLYIVLRNVDYEKYQVVIATTEIDKIAKSCEEINPDIRITASEFGFNETWAERILKKRNKSFYTKQKQKFFFDIDFDIYVNLKKQQGLIDEIFGAFDSVKKYWLVNETEEPSIVAKKDITNYEDVFVFCSENTAMAEAETNHCHVIDRKQIAELRHGHMNVLCIAAFDSMNYTLVACIEELKKRGHQVTVVVKDINDKINNKMYFEKNIEMIPVSDFDIEALNYIDFVLSAPVKFQAFRKIYRGIKDRKIFMCSFSSLFSSIVMRVNPDVVFCLGENKFKELKDNNLQYPCIAVGNPQYDTLVDKRKDAETVIKNVLVVDQGGYPYGAKGKQQLAETLIRLAKENPDMNFEIKPRYLPGEQGQTAHRVSEHLFDYLQDMPQNLSVISVSTILEEIAPDYDAMITTWSTAYLDALMMDMPLILIGGLDSEDVFDVRKYRVQDAYQYLEKTGCLYDYRELGDLKTQFRVVDSEYVTGEVYDYKNASAEKIVDFLEYCNVNLLQKGLRFNQFFELSLQEFYQCFEELKKIDVDSRAFETRYEYYNAFNTLMQEYVYQNRCMGGLMDLLELEQYYNANFSEEQDYEAVIPTMKGEAETTFIKIKNVFFTSEKVQALIKKEKVLQDFYFDWLYENGQYDIIKNYEGSLLAPESREYYLALMELKKNKKKAYEHLFSFLEVLFDSDVLQLLKEKRLARSLKPFRTGVNKLWFYFYLYRQQKFELVDYLDQTAVEKNAATTWFKMKGANQAGQYNKCLQVYARYNENYQKQRKRLKGIRKKMSFCVKRLINIFVVREARQAEKKGGINHYE